MPDEMNTSWNEYQSNKYRLNEYRLNKYTFCVKKQNETDQLCLRLFTCWIWWTSSSKRPYTALENPSNCRCFK